jgi:hypothetical protein
VEVQVAVEVEIVEECERACGSFGRATTVRLEARKTLLTDGPFVDSKEFLGGLILVEADNLEPARDRGEASSCDLGCYGPEP